MKKSFIYLFIILLAGCAKDQSDFTLKGNIKGLKKGTVYLQKLKDSSLVTIDSLIINGNPDFELNAKLDSPQMLYLKLHKFDNEEHIVPFFADKGITEFSTTVKNFELDTKIKGSKQQEKLEEYQLNMSRFNDQNLDLIKEHLEAQNSQDSSRIDATIKKYNNLIKRKYLYTVNFAINNKDSEVAPYLALTQIYDANIKFLDTINNSLAPKVKTSFYGKELQKLIDKRKSE